MIDRCPFTSILPKEIAFCAWMTRAFSLCCREGMRRSDGIQMHADACRCMQYALMCGPRTYLPGKEIKDAEVTCDVCGCDCAEESYLYDDEMDICPRCFKLDAESAQQYEDATHQRWGKPVE